MATSTSGALRLVSRRPQRWGGSVVLRALDDALAAAGVRKGDYLVVERGKLLRESTLVVVQGREGELVLRTAERYGPSVRLQPGCAPRRPLLLPADGAGILGTVVAVLRKFDFR